MPRRSASRRPAAVRSGPQVASGHRVVCSNCGTDNPAGTKFCIECAARLAQVCPSCGTANLPTAKFCGECAVALQGAILAASSAPARPASGPSGVSAPAPIAERRLVSILFADLVGFTTLAEGRDAEDTRELLCPLLRALARGDRPLRRHRREVHRRRGDGRLGCAGRPRGRRRAGRPGRRSTSSTRSARSARPIAGPGRRPDRRGGRHARRDEPGAWSRATS